MHFVCVINKTGFSTNRCFPLAQTLHNNDMETENDYRFALCFSSQTELKFLWSTIVVFCAGKDQIHMYIQP